MKPKIIFLLLPLLALTLSNFVQFRRANAAERRADQWEAQARLLLDALKKANASSP